MYDDSVRVPLMVIGPNVPKNKKIDTPVYLQDIMPSTLELAGVENPKQVQFKSLMPLVSGKSKSSYDAIYGGYIDLQRMVCMDGYKMIYYPKIDKTLLYNLKEDPFEMKNLADDPDNNGRIKKLKAHLKELQKEVGDTLDLDKPGKS